MSDLCIPALACRTPPLRRPARPLRVLRGRPLVRLRPLVVRLLLLPVLRLRLPLCPRVLGILFSRPPPLCRPRLCLQLRVSLSR